MSTQLLSIFNTISRAEDITDYYQALYWYAAENHAGQYSTLYYVLSSLHYKPSLTETSDDVNWETLNISITHDNMIVLSWALELYKIINESNTEDRHFARLHYFEAKNLYLAEYHDFNEDAEYSTYYAVYSVDESGTIIDETITD